jgi:hypothetical protein
MTAAEALQLLAALIATAGASTVAARTRAKSAPRLSEVEQELIVVTSK